MALLVVGFPEIAAADFDWIQDVRRDHDSERYHLIPPHLTFVFPSEGLDEATLVAHAATIASSTAPFTFELDHLLIDCDGEAGLWHVFLVPSAGSDGVNALHDRLYTGILAPWLRADIPYVPHLTIASSTDAESCESLIRDYAHTEPHIPCRISSLQVLSYDDGRITPNVNLQLTG